MLPLLLLSVLLVGVASGGRLPAEHPTAPQEALVLGIIDFGAERNKEVLAAPSTAQVGEDFKITITTFGGGCERAAQAGVVMTASGASVMIYDLTAATHSGIICTAVIKLLRHQVTLRFEKPGEALIRIWGRRVGPETPPFGVPVVIEHPISVE
jgi:hypothetical protein